MSIIKIKRSATADKVPTTDDMELGEIAINTFDGKIFVKVYDGKSDIKSFLNIDDTLSFLSNNSSLKITADQLADILGDTLEIQDGKLEAVDCGECTTTNPDSNWNEDSDFANAFDSYQDYSYDINYDGDDTYIRDGGDDIYDDGNTIKYNGNILSYNNAIYKNYGFLIFKLDNTSSIKFEGETGADGSGSVLNDTLLLDDDTVHCSYKVIENGRGSDPSIHHVIFVKSDVDITHNFSDDTNDDYDEYSFSRTCRAFLIVYWSPNDVAWYNDRMTYQNLYNLLFKGEY